MLLRKVVFGVVGIGSPPASSEVRSGTPQGFLGWIGNAASFGLHTAWWWKTTAMPIAGVALSYASDGGFALIDVGELGGSARIDGSPPGRLS